MLWRCYWHLNQFGSAEINRYIVRTGVWVRTQRFRRMNTQQAYNKCAIYFRRRRKYKQCDGASKTTKIQIYREWVDAASFLLYIQWICVWKGRGWHLSLTLSDWWKQFERGQPDHCLTQFLTVFSSLIALVRSNKNNRVHTVVTYNNSDSGIS